MLTSAKSNDICNYIYIHIYIFFTDISKSESDDKVTYELKYLNNTATKTNKSSEVYITDIDNFKSELPIYPLKDTLG